VKAIVIHTVGGEAPLRLEERPAPVPGPGSVLLRVGAAGVNYADLVQRRGHYPGGPQPPYIPGFEAAGVIEAVGDGVPASRVGERVMGVVPAGAYAEVTTAEAGTLLPVPEAWSFEEAAAFPVVTLTAYHVLHTVARLQPGETVLIHAAAGGVGTAAVQLARAADARVIATASSDEKLARVRELGADHLINYTTVDFLEEVQRLTGGRGVEVVLESVGGDVFDRSLRALAPLGRLVVFGVAGGEPRSVETVRLLFESKSVMGFHLSAVMRRPDLLHASLQAIQALLDAGKLRPIVGHVFPLADAEEAHRQMAARSTYGKIVLVP
jgi:NADPH2:quinone reductase